MMKQYFSSNFFFERWLGNFDSLCISLCMPCCPAQREPCKKWRLKKSNSRPKQLAFGRAQVRWNGTIELDKNPLRAKSESGAIRLIMGGNFVKFCVSRFSRFSKSGAGCGSLWNARSRSQIGSSLPTAGEKVCIPVLTRTLNPAVAGV